jgi:hypothetical protein
VELAKKYGSGRYDFRVKNPRTGRVEPKSMYFELVEGIVVGRGSGRRNPSPGGARQRVG